MRYEIDYELDGTTQSYILSGAKLNNKNLHEIASTIAKCLDNIYAQPHKLNGIDVYDESGTYEGSIDYKH